jgi:hypothetical protein
MVEGRGITGSCYADLRTCARANTENRPEVSDASSRDKKKLYAARDDLHPRAPSRRVLERETEGYAHNSGARLRFIVTRRNEDGHSDRR